MMRKSARKPPERAKPEAGIRERLMPIYERMPEFPFLDRSTMWLIVAAMALYFAFTAAVFLASPGLEVNTQLVEAPIHKNAALALLPGERYSYLVSSYGQAQMVEYGISSSPDCIGVLVEESLTGNSLCLSRSGNLASDASQLNSSFGNQSVLLFFPWMLAASENFTWQARTVFSSGATRFSTSTYLSSSGAKEVLGRKAYAILITSELSQPSTLFVDAEKRILLYADMGNSSVLLVSAPFALNGQLPQK